MRHFIPAFYNIQDFLLKRAILDSGSQIHLKPPCVGQGMEILNLWV